MKPTKKLKKGAVINCQLSLVTIASFVLIGAAVSWANEVPATTSTPASGNIQFQPPSSEAPRRVLGGGSRGSIGFTPPSDDRAPTTSRGGGSRGSIGFTPSDDRAPTTSRGGGSRGSIGFTPADDRAPTTSRGGGSRGEGGFIPADDRAPTTSRGGGSRGEVDFTPTDDRAPTTVRGGGSRSDPRLLYPAALVPSTNLGWTISDHPTFFVYIPRTSAKQIFFSLYSEDRQYHYQTTFELNKTGGIVAIRMPPEAPALEMGKPYQWSVILLEPGEIMRPDAYSITGWVKRVAVPPAEGSLNTIERAALYGKSGIWYDMLNVLVSARLAQPENATLTKEWADLLQQVGLEYLAREPLAQQL